MYLATLRLRFPHVMQISHALLKRVQVLQTTFSMYCVSFHLPFLAAPLLIFFGKNKTLSTGRKGTSEQSMRGASVKEAAAGPGDVGEGENLSVNPTIYPVQAAENRGKSSIFPLQQSSAACRLSHTVQLHDCSGHRMVRCLSGETEAWPHHMFRW